MSSSLAKAVQTLQSGVDLCLVTIISQQGSVPRPMGTFFWVPAKGEPLGSVGGGAMEAFAMDQARAALEAGATGLVAFGLPSLPAGPKGMACGGQVELFLEPFLAQDQASLGLVATAAGLLDKGKKAMLLSQVEAGDSGPAWQRKLLLPPGGDPMGGLGLSSGEVARVSQATRKLGAAELRPITAVDGGEIQVFSQLLVPRPSLYVMGSGHVAKELAVLAAFLEYRLVVVDDRPELANLDRFPQAQQILVRGLDDAFAGLTPGTADMVVIMTRSHAQDMEVLAQALRLPFGYVGMLGSDRKRRTIFKALSERGYSQKDLSRVKSPIGLPIGAETPREIALAIAAELLQHRSGLDFPQLS